MKSLLSIVFVYLCVFAASSFSAFGQTKRILFIAGEPSHGWNRHEFPAGCELLASCLNRSSLPVETSISQGWPDNQATLEDADAIVIYSDGNEKHVARGKADILNDLYQKGTGFAILHYALEPGEPALDAFLEIAIGGYFKVDWSVNPVWTLESPRFAKHPINSGIEDIKLEDEWYYHMKFQPDSPGIIHLLQTVPPLSSLGEDGPRTGNPTVREAVRNGVPQSLAWAHIGEDNQRGFGYTGGHFHYNWNQPGARKLALNGIAWTAGLEIPETGIDSEIAPIVVHQSIEHAIARGDKEDTLRHLANDSQLLNKPGRGSYTPLHQAILRKKPDIVSTLLELKANPNIPTNSGQTALHIAVSRNDSNATEAVLQAGADMTAKDGNGWTPLHLAAAKNRIELVQLLLDSGSNINALSDAGGTPLHEASVSAGPELIQLLIDKGVDPKVVSKTGKTALDHAVEFKNEAAIEILSEFK
ncbi:MAG TPA: hypothetical protein DIV79_15080 [Opitutae bacterium]|nr:hypothetical protein [Opitutaceae bacterium]HCR31328.1 hypothetical protein [Opitutae bacterium]